MIPWKIRVATPIVVPKLSRTLPTVGVDIAGPELDAFHPADYRALFRRCRRKGLGITVHTGESGPVEEIAAVIEELEPDRLGHGVKAAYDQRTMDLIRERGITLEICPTSNLNSRVVSGWDEFRWIFDTFRRNGVRYTINTDGPEMLKTYIRDEMASLSRHGILSVEEQEQAADVGARGLLRARCRRRPRTSRGLVARPPPAARSSARRPEGYPAAPLAGQGGRDALAM